MFGQMKPGGGAPSGMSMLLKSMGFDPDDFKSKIEDIQTAATTVVRNVNTRLEMIETQLGIQTAHLEKIQKDQQLIIKLVVPMDAPDPVETQEVDLWPTIPPPTK